MGPQTERWLRIGTVAIALLVTGSIVVAGIGVGDQATASVEFDDGSAEVQESDDDRNFSNANASYAGAKENDSAGWSVTEAGDVNGDGETDFLVGAPRRHDNSTGNGTAYLFYGPVEDGEFDVADANVTFEGPEQADRTGVAVAGGDIDGDGYADVVVGAPHANSSERYAGAVYVVSGGDDLNETVRLADANATLEGEAWGDHAGYAVDVVNDTTGNGSDVVVGAPYNNSVNQTAGAVYLLQGGELDLNGTDELSLSDVGTKYAGEGYGDRAGWSVAEAGDVNDDGVADVVVGAYSNNTGANDAGAAYVIYGHNDSQDERESDASLADADAKLVGVDVDDNAGYAVDGAGDVNGDGVADVVVGAPYSDAAADDAGAAYVLHGGDLSDETSLEAANLTLYGENEDDIAGFAVSGGPCDERVIVGAPGTDEATGAAHVVAANATGTASLDDATATFTGEARGDSAGFSLAGATNVSGEDAEELLVGAPYADSNANDSGTAYLVRDVCPTDEEAKDDEPIDTGEEPRDDAPTDDDRDERADDDDRDERADDGEAPDEPTDRDDTPVPTHDDPPERPDDDEDDRDDDGRDDGDDRDGDDGDDRDGDDETDTTSTLDVANQTGDGTSLTVDNASASVDYYLEVRNNGTVLNETTVVDAGESFKGNLSLDPPLTENATVRVSLRDADTDTELNATNVSYSVVGDTDDATEDVNDTSNATEDVNDTSNATDGDNQTNESDMTEGNESEADDTAEDDEGDADETTENEQSDANDTAEDDVGDTNETTENEQSDANDTTEDNESAGPSSTEESEPNATDGTDGNGTDADDEPSKDGDGTDEEDSVSDGPANETESGDDGESNESAVVGEFQSDNETASEGPAATSIETGTTVSGDEQEAETRRFEFEADDGEAIRVTLPGGTGDVQYTLYGPDGEQIAQGVPSSDARAIGGVADASGTYSVEATAPGYDVLGQYRFRVTTSADDGRESNDDRSSAAAVSPGDSLDATLFEGDEDWYAVDLSAGETYRAAVELTDSDTELGNNVRVEVYDESGQKVIPTATSGPGVTEKGIEYRYTAEQVVEIFDDGTYYVRVTGADDPGSFDGYEDYRLTLEADAGDDGMDDEAADEAAGVGESEETAENESAVTSSDY